MSNIDAAALTHDASKVLLITLMTRALERIKSLNGVRPVFYMNRTLRSFLRTQAVAKIAGSTLAFDNIGGKPMLSFCEVPVKRCDQLGIDERSEERRVGKECVSTCSYGGSQTN